MTGASETSSGETAGAGAAPATIDQTTVHELDSEVVGEPYTLSVALPAGYAEGDESFPVVYLTDPFFAYGSTVESVRLHTIDGRMPPAIVVGVGYPGEQEFGRIMDLRTRDFSPTDNPTFPAGDPPWSPEVELGGAEAFMDFLAEEAIPFVEERYRVTDDRTYVGHSGGASFGLHLLFERPALFDRYLISSPQLWYDDELLFDIEASYAANHQGLPARVFIAVGEREPHFVVGSVRKLLETLEARAYEEFTLHSTVLPGETHFSMWPVAVNRGLRVLFDADTS